MRRSVSITGGITYGGILTAFAIKRFTMRDRYIWQLVESANCLERVEPATTRSVDIK